MPLSRENMKIAVRIKKGGDADKDQCVTTSRQQLTKIFEEMGGTIKISGDSLSITSPSGKQATTNNFDRIELHNGDNVISDLMGDALEFYCAELKKKAGQDPSAPTASPDQ